MLSRTVEERERIGKKERRGEKREKEKREKEKEGRKKEKKEKEEKTCGTKSSRKTIGFCYRR
jgi:hypothetical protein